MTTKTISKRLILVAFDVCSLALIAALLSLGLTQVAYAYVDPSVMTYTIQALAGVAVALSAVAGVAFRRSRRALMRALGIDENRNKQVESDVHRVVNGQAVLTAADVTAAGEGRHAKGFAGFGKAGKGSGSAVASDGAPSPRKVYRPKWYVRLLLALVVCVFAVFTVGVVAPYEIVAGSETSLVFGLRDIWQPILIYAAAFAGILVVIVTLLRGRVFNAVLLVIFSFGLGFYIQAMFLNTGLPPADGSVIVWTNYQPIAAVSAIVWALILIVPVAISSLNYRAVQSVAAVVSLALIIVQGVGVGSLFVNMNEATEEPVAEESEESEAVPTADDYVLTEEGMYTVSSKSNVIVFVLDTYDTQDLITATAADPFMLGEMEGFTWYRDSVGAMVPTRYGVPFLLTGQYPQVGEDPYTYFTSLYPRSSMLSDISAAGYSMGIYTDSLGDGSMTEEQRRTLIYDKTINIKVPPTVTDEGKPVEEAKPTLDEKGMLYAMAECALYRDMPWIGKPFFWFYTDQVNNAMTLRDEDSEEGEESADSSSSFASVNEVGAETSADAAALAMVEAQSNAASPYTMDDSRWFNNLKSKRLSITADDQATNGAFRFIHLVGTHYPYNIDENGNDIGLWQSDVNRQARGSMKMVSEYLRQLKELGVYDNCTIIITADHGYWYLTDKPLEEPTSPILLVKPAGAERADVKTSFAPVATADVMPTLMAGVQGADYAKYGTRVYDVPEGIQRDRRYIMTTSRNEHDSQWLEYNITGNVLDMANWHLTGNEWQLS